MFTLQPIDDRIVVKPDDAEEMSAGGIFIPDDAREKQHRGKVVAVGPGRVIDDGSRIPSTLVVGDEVIYAKWGGDEVKVDGKQYRVLRESDILAKVTT